MQLTQRLQALPASQTAEVKRLADQLKRDGVRVYDFGVGEPDFPTPEHVQAAAREAMAKQRTKYTAARGIVELREAIAQRYNARHGTAYGPQHVVVTVGAKQALYNLMMALVEPGGEVVVPAPYWVSYPAEVQLAGGVPVFVATDEAAGFRVTAAQIEAALTPRTRAICLNSPCNPTGAVLDAGTLDAVAELARARGVALIYDECYESFTYGTAHHNPARRAPGHVFSVGSVSKSYAMTGWRIGWVIGDEGVMAGVDRFQSQSTSNPTSISQWAALAALTGDQAPVEAMQAAYARRRRLVLELLAEIPGLNCATPEGAFYAFPNVQACLGGSIGDSVALAKHLLETACVATVPGSGFGAEGHLRLSYAAPDADLEAGLGRMKDALGALR